MWHDVKSLVANEMAKVNEKMEGICQKLSTLEIKVQTLEADKDLYIRGPRRACKKEKTYSVVSSGLPS